SGRRPRRRKVRWRGGGPRPWERPGCPSGPSGPLAARPSGTRHGHSAGDSAAAAPPPSPTTRRSSKPMSQAPASPRYTVALTGGVASGKSTVGGLFKALRIHVADADIASREVIAPGSEGLAEVVATFGAGVLDASGALDRSAMRKRVFGVPAARRQLEPNNHTRVRSWQPYAYAS